VNESRLVADRMHGHLRRAGDCSGVLSQFVAALSPEEAAELRRILERRGKPA
jgi:predicted transcriptional regulator